MGLFDSFKGFFAMNSVAKQIAKKVAEVSGVPSFSTKDLQNILGVVVGTRSVPADARYHALAVALLGEPARHVDYSLVVKRIQRTPYLRVLHELGMLPLLHQILVEQETSRAEGYLAFDLEHVITEVMTKVVPEDVKDMVSGASALGSLTQGLKKPAPLF